MAVADKVGSRLSGHRGSCLSCFSSLLKITFFPVSYLLPENLPNAALAIPLICVWNMCRHLSVFVVPTPSFLILLCVPRNVSILSCRSIYLTINHFMRLLLFKAFLKCLFFCEGSHFFNQSSLPFAIFCFLCVGDRTWGLVYVRQALCHIHIPPHLDIFYSFPLA